MAGDTDTTESAAERLESALERIAHLAERAAPGEDQRAAQPTAEIAARLDGIIERLRAALDTQS